LRIRRHTSEDPATARFIPPSRDADVAADRDGSTIVNGATVTAAEVDP
jgi:hypothetical protein